MLLLVAREAVDRSALTEGQELIDQSRPTLPGRVGYSAAPKAGHRFAFTHQRAGRLNAQHTQGPSKSPKIKRLI